MIIFFYFRDSFKKSYSYEPISCIEFQGELTGTEESQGHYICDVKTHPLGKWFRTNDNFEPKEINQFEVSKAPYVVLFKRK